MHEPSGRGGFDAASSRDESDALDFKRGFDPKKTSDWCELIKDMVAMTNSGGGQIVIGIDDDGARSGEDVSDFLKVDRGGPTNLDRFRGRDKCNSAGYAAAASG